MGTITYTGFSITFDDDDDPISVGTATLTLAVINPGTAAISYAIAGEAEPGDLPDVIISGTQPLLVDINGQMASDFFVNIGRVTTSAGNHDIIAFYDEATDTDFIFLMGGDPLTFPTNLDELAALEDDITSAGAIPDGPFAPGQSIPLLSLAGASLNTGPQIIKSGYVSEDPANGFHEIGMFFGDPDRGNGSVTVLGGAHYTLPRDGEGYTMLYVGGYGASGTIAVAGAGSRADIVGGSGADDSLHIQVGTEEGVGVLRAVDGGEIALLSGFAGAGENATRSYLGFGGMMGQGALFMNDGTLRIEGFETSYITVAEWGANGLVELRNGSSLIMAPTDFARVWVGGEGDPFVPFDTGGTISVQGGSSMTIGALHEMLIGYGIDGMGSLVVTGAGSRVQATLTTVPDADPLIVVGSGEATGRMDITNGGRLEILPNGGSNELLFGIGQYGNGEVYVLSGGVIDLGGGATVKVGSANLDPLDAYWPNGQLVVGGTGSTITGFAEMWIGHDPATIAGDVTPRGAGKLVLGGVEIGNTGAAVNLGIMGQIDVIGQSKITGDLNLHGGFLGMSEATHDTLTVTGDVNLLAGFNTIMIAARAGSTDTVQIDGALNLQDGSLSLMLEKALDYSFTLGEQRTLITFGELIDGDAGFDPILMHSFLDPDFSYKFAVDSTIDGSLIFRALSDMDGTDKLALDFAFGDSALLLEYDPLEGLPGQPGEFNWQGGGWYGGIAVNVEQIIGTNFNDVIDLTGATADMFVFGGFGNDLIRGGAGNDTIIGGPGNDTIDGGGGINTAEFTFDRDEYLIDQNPTTGVVTVTDTRTVGANEGINTLTNIQFLKFANETVEIDLTPATFALTGAVALRGAGAGGANPGGTVVTFTPDGGGGPLVATLDASGAFAFDLDAGTSGTLSVGRGYATPADKALSPLDALEVLRLVAGLGPSNAENPVGGMSTLAADFNGDGQITAMDALGILLHVGQFAGATAPNWLFADDPAALPAFADLGAGLTGVPLPSGFGSIAIGPMAGDLDIAFTGILSGDNGYYPEFA